MRAARLALPICLAVSIACSGNDLVVCTTQFVPGVVVEIRDSVTGLPLAQGARGSVQDGVFIDSLRPFSTAGLQAAGERPGIYDVTVVHLGYADWIRAEVRVERGICHVRTATLQALLQPT